MTNDTRNATATRQDAQGNGSAAAELQAFRRSRLRELLAAAAAGEALAVPIGNALHTADALLELLDALTRSAARAAARRGDFGELGELLAAAERAGVESAE